MGHVTWSCRVKLAANSSEDEVAFGNVVKKRARVPGPPHIIGGDRRAVRVVELRRSTFHAHGRTVPLMIGFARADAPVSLAEPYRAQAILLCGTVVLMKLKWFELHGLLA